MPAVPERPPAGDGTKLDALFVGYENQENLGLRYVMAYLEAHGVRTELAPYTPDNPEPIVEAAIRRAPDLVGFSRIVNTNGG